MLIWKGKLPNLKYNVNVSKRIEKNKFFHWAGRAAHQDFH